MALTFAAEKETHRHRDHGPHARCEQGDEPAQETQQEHHTEAHRVAVPAAVLRAQESRLRGHERGAVGACELRGGRHSRRIAPHGSGLSGDHARDVGRHWCGNGWRGSRGRRCLGAVRARQPEVHVGGRQAGLTAARAVLEIALGLIVRPREPDALCETARVLVVFHVHLKHVVVALHGAGARPERTALYDVLGLVKMERGRGGAAGGDVDRVDMPSALDPAGKGDIDLGGRDTVVGDCEAYRVGSRGGVPGQHQRGGHQQQARQLRPQRSQYAVAHHLTSISLSLKISVAEGGTLPSPSSP